MPNIKSFGHTASEEVSFEIVDDDGRTPDHGHPISSPMSLPFGSGELKMWCLLCIMATSCLGLLVYSKIQLG